MIIVMAGNRLEAGIFFGGRAVQRWLRCDGAHSKEQKPMRENVTWIKLWNTSNMKGMNSGKDCWKSDVLGLTNGSHGRSISLIGLLFNPWKAPSKRLSACPAHSPSVSLQSSFRQSIPQCLRTYGSPWGCRPLSL